MNLAWWLAVPSTGIGGTVRKQAAMTLRLFWQSLTRADRVVIAALLVLLLAWGFLVFSRHLGKGWRRVLSTTTGTTALLVATLSWWAHRLPQSKTGVFILWHQLVRAGAVVCGVTCLFGLMGLLLPKVLDYIERRGFVSFVAARHVRANKSGFLTIISVLSISGVALSCMTLCLVTSIMGGFGADLKRKILGNNAHVRIEAAGVRGFDHWREVLASTRRVPSVLGATPIAAGEVMASSASSTAGAIIRGIDPESIGSVIDLLKNIEVGKIEYMKNPALLTQLSPEEPVGLGPGGEVYLKGPDYRSHFTTHLGDSGVETTPAEDVYPGIVIGRELAKSLHDRNPSAEPPLPCGRCLLQRHVRV
jgi:lipoprotein-releasing system permease protein